MFILSNFVILLILTTCVLAGLDKLIPTALYIGIIFFSDIFNQVLSINKESVILSFLPSLFSEEKKVKLFKITNCFFIILIWLTIISGVAALAGGYGLSVGDSLNSKLFCVCTYLVLFFYGLFAVRLVQEDKNKASESQWYRLLQYLAIFQIIFGLYFIAIDSLGFEEELREKYLYVVFDYSILAVLGYLFCLLIERLLDTVRVLSAILKNNEHKYQIPFFVSIIASNNSLKDSLIKTIELISGVDLSKSEIAKYIVLHVEPVTIIALIIFWLLSSVVIIPPNKEAIFYKLGKISGNQSYKPGIHFKFPWPFERMELYEPNLIKTINIGFTPDPHQKNIIWSKSHATENFFLLVGNGAEIIAVDCQLYYKINSLFKYVTKVQNPKSYVEAITYKILTAKTVSQTFDQIMSQNRHNFASELKKEVQEQLDKEDLGITIVDLMFLAIHPPVEVAEAYEDVISAQVDKQTYILKQESESTKEICMKKAFAYDAIAKSKSYAVTTVSNAVGEAVAFEKKVIAFNTEPELERFRLRLDSILKVSKSKNLYVIDKSIMRKNDRIILNLQN